MPIDPELESYFQQAENDGRVFDRTMPVSILGGNISDAKECNRPRNVEPPPKKWQIYKDEMRLLALLPDRHAEDRREVIHLLWQVASKTSWDARDKLIRDALEVADIYLDPYGNPIQ